MLFVRGRGGFLGGWVGCGIGRLLLLGRAFLKLGFGLALEGEKGGEYDEIVTLDVGRGYTLSCGRNLYGVFNYYRILWLICVY